MIDTKIFGSVLSPVRSSGLQSLVACSWRPLSEMLFDFKDDSGPAAATGSAMHAAAAKFHQCYDIVRSVDEMHGRRDEYPLANFDDAAKLFFAYVQDPRNLDRNVVLVEHSISFVMPAADGDPTGQPIHVRGRLDQVRSIGGQLFAYDIKTSTREGPVLMAEALYQVCAYSIGASVYLKQDVHPGALILPRKYFRRGVDPCTAPSGVFWNYTLRREHCESVLDGVRTAVAAVRAGKPWVNAADYCNYCQYHGIDGCVPEYDKYMKLGTGRLQAP